MGVVDYESLREAGERRIRREIVDAGRRKKAYGQCSGQREGTMAGTEKKSATGSHCRVAGIAADELRAARRILGASIWASSWRVGSRNDTWV